ncbi:MAG: hypothetical protein AB1814_02460 [Thermodesulfobacteriota bacterium]
MAAKLSRQQLVRAVDSLRPYPAVLLPRTEGGFEVIFPNLPRVRSYGISRDAAVQNGIETLTFELGQMVVAGETPPPPSHPERLIPDAEEPAGTQLMMLEPDKAVLRRRLGLEKREKGHAMAAALGRLGRN